MNDFEAQIRSLREALHLSPQNVPLRRHLAALLLQAGDFEGAEAEFRRALKMDPTDKGVQLGLARAFHTQGKHDLAMMILEDYLLNDGEPTAEVFLLHARVLAFTGKIPEAVAAYERARAIDPTARDAELAERLGLDGAAHGASGDAGQSVSAGRLRDAFDDDDGPATVEAERPKIDFSAVGGMEALKQEIRLKIILPLTNKDLYAAYGKKIGGGILMYGPPGCGKTHLARATAGEIKSNFLSIGLHDVLNMWMGQSEQRLHQLFEQARRNTPCVLFFDEVDALAASRSDLRKSAGRNLVNQFLAELDGDQASNEGVLILAATNAPWNLDNAFKRPGRFDRILFVPPPDAPARRDILTMHLQGKPLERIDAEKIAAKTEGFSGADMKALVDMAVEQALEEAMQRGTAVPIGEAGLLRALKKLRPSTREWFASARNHALYANEGGLYDDVLAHLKIKA